MSKLIADRDWKDPLRESYAGTSTVIAKLTAGAPKKATMSLIAPSFAHQMDRLRDDLPG